jgi:hypothetical protein
VNSRAARSCLSATLFGWTMTVLAAGCATAGETSHHGLGVGQWEARLPTTESPVHELAMGRNGSSLRDDKALASLDDVLQPSAASKSMERPKALRRQAAAPVVATATPMAQPMAAQPMAAQTIAVAPSVELLASNDVEARYAERETQSKQVEQFRGGDVVVISASALVLVLLIVLLIILLR